MRRSKPYFILSAVLVAALIGFPFHLQAAGRGGGGGFSGGSFRGGGGYVEGPRGGVAVRGPEGGTAVKTPDGAVRAEGSGGGEFARGPGGGAAVEGPGGGTAVRGPGGGVVAKGPEGGIAVKTPDGTVIAGGSRPASDWDHFYGPAWDNAVAASGASGAMSFTDTLPDNVTTVVVDGQTYYVSNGVYYQECMMGSDVLYCVVAPPK
jgi:hypothetical protein